MLNKNDSDKLTIQDKFKKYLKNRGYKEFSSCGNQSTVYDYIKRIDKVCGVENYSWHELANAIHKIIPLYDIGGEKEDIGNKSHRSVINALKRFQEFINDDV